MSLDDSAHTRALAGSVRLATVCRCLFDKHLTRADLSFRTLPDGTEIAVIMIRQAKSEKGFTGKTVPVAGPLGISVGATDYWPTSPNQSEGPRMIGHHPMGNLCETRDMEADYKTKISEKKNFRYRYRF